MMIQCSDRALNDGSMILLIFRARLLGNESSCESHVDAMLSGLIGMMILLSRIQCYKGIESLKDNERVPADNT